MRRTTTTMLAAAVALMPVIAEAKKDDYEKHHKKIEKAYKKHEKAHKKINKAYEKADKEWQKAHDNDDVVYVRDCPPGLAKKSPACVPPGQAKKYGHTHVYHRGDVIESNYQRIANPAVYGLDPNLAYYLVADQIYRMDPNTRKVLAIVGLAAELLN